MRWGLEYVVNELGVGFLRIQCAGLVQVSLDFIVQYFACEGRTAVVYQLADLRGQARSFFCHRVAEQVHDALPGVWRYIAGLHGREESLVVVHLIIKQRDDLRGH